MNFAQRSSEKELLDEENIPLADLHQNLKELAFINTFLGGFSVTRFGLSQLLLDKTKTYHLADIGCGGGDNLIAIANWAKKNNVKVELSGIDMKMEAIAYAEKNCSKYPNIHFIVSDYKLTQFKEPVDVIVSSLFCHHLNEQELMECILWMSQNARTGFLINDLQRNKIAYYSIKWLTALFSKSYLVKNDAAVSVSRGFKKRELNELLRKSGVKNYSISWKWAFRYLIVVKN